MSGFEPGEGWREVALNEAPFEDYLYLNEDRVDRYWVREVPVQPLPTEPYTVIRVELKHTDRSSCDLVLDETGAWCAVQSDMEWGPAQVVEMMTGSFEVLAEPRAETAKAVLDRVRVEFAPHNWSKKYLDAIAREFGVTS